MPVTLANGRCLLAGLLLYILGAATAFALAVVMPSAGNVGGGGFLVHHGAAGDVTTFELWLRRETEIQNVLRVDPDSGEVIAWIDLTGLLEIILEGCTPIEDNISSSPSDAISKFIFSVLRYLRIAMSGFAFTANSAPREMSVPKAA